MTDRRQPDCLLEGCEQCQRCGHVRSRWGELPDTQSGLRLSPSSTTAARLG